MTTAHFTIPHGDAGTIATLQHMARLASDAATSLAVRDTAAMVVRGSGRDGEVHARLLDAWIGEHTEFLADPTNAEALNQVDRSLALIATYGVAQMDCDDVATLAAALGLSIGLRARFRVVAFGASERDPYAHVWTELSPLDREAWLTIDPSRPIVGLPPISRTLVMEL